MPYKYPEDKHNYSVWYYLKNKEYIKMRNKIYYNKNKEYIKMRAKLRRENQTSENYN